MISRVRRQTAAIRSASQTIASQLVGIDLRALGAFRIGLGILLLTDLAVRSTDLSIFYTDDGVLPRTVLLDRSSKWMVSIYMLSGTPAVVALLFIAAGVAAACLLVGYRTRLAAVVSWIFLTSIQYRNPYVNQNGDLLLHLILFWGLFLPLGARYSLDSLRKRDTPPSGRVVSFASVALLAQVVMMYVFASFLKTGPDWTRNSTAVYYALQYRLLATPRAHLLLQFPGLLKLVSHSVVWLERFGPVLFFIPIVGAPIRTLAAFGFMSFHLGMSTFLALGPFMWVPDVALIAFLPTWFWDHAERILSRTRLGSLPGRATASAARVAFLLPAAFLMAVPGGPSGRTAEEHLAADAEVAPPPRNEPVLAPFERRTHRDQPSWLTLARRTLMSVLPLWLLVYVFLINLQTVTTGRNVVPPHLNWLGDSFSLNQQWGMFAPNPPHASGWFVIPGTLVNGQTLDFWRGPRPLSWKQPSSILALYPDERWRKYAENLWRFSVLQTDYARYLCRSWNGSHTGGQRLDRFKMYFMQLNTPPKASDPEKPQKILDVTWYCLGKPPKGSH